MKKINKHKFSELMMEHRQRFYRMAFSYVKNTEDALDIVGEATYKGLKNLNSLEDASIFVTWMTKIIMNTAIDDIRRRTRRDSYIEILARSEENLVQSEPELNFDLYAAIDFLEAEEKSYIILRYFEEYSFVQISEMLEIPESTLKSRMYKILKKMKSHMEGGAAS